MKKILLSLVVIGFSVMAHADPIDLVCEHRYVITMTNFSNQVQLSKLIKKNFKIQSAYTSNDGYTIVTVQAYKPQTLAPVVENIYNLGGSIECDEFGEADPRLGGSN